LYPKTKQKHTAEALRANGLWPEPQKTKNNGQWSIAAIGHWRLTIIIVLLLTF
jgi:hypothetical protein